MAHRKPQSRMTSAWRSQFSLRLHSFGNLIFLFQRRLASLEPCGPCRPHMQIARHIDTSPAALQANEEIHRMAGDSLESLRMGKPRTVEETDGG